MSFDALEIEGILPPTRLDERRHVAWDDPTAIMPSWNRGSQPVLVIPADQQKNDTEEAIPLLPGFESILEE